MCRGASQVVLLGCKKMLAATNTSLATTGGAAVNNRSREQQLLESIDRLSGMIQLLVTSLKENDVSKPKRGTKPKRSAGLNKKLTAIQTSLDVISTNQTADSHFNVSNGKSEAKSARTVMGLLLLGLGTSYMYSAYDGLLDDSQLYAQSPATWDTLAATLAKATPDQISALRREVSKLSHQVVAPDPVVTSATPLNASSFGFRPWTAPPSPTTTQSDIWPDNISPQRSLHGGSFGASSISMDQSVTATLISPQPATGRSLMSEGGKSSFDDFFNRSHDGDWVPVSPAQ